MRRKIVGATLLVTLAVAAGWNFNQSKNETTLSEIGLANVDALASGENPYDCPNGCLTDPGDCYCHFYFPYEEA